MRHQFADPTVGGEGGGGSVPLCVVRLFLVYSWDNFSTVRLARGKGNKDQSEDWSLCNLLIYRYSGGANGLEIIDESIAAQRITSFVG